MLWFPEAALCGLATFGLVVFGSESPVGKRTVLNEDADRTGFAAVEGLGLLRSSELACGTAKLLEEGWGELRDDEIIGCVGNEVSLTILTPFVVREIGVCEVATFCPYARSVTLSL
jgi:hypothetical protein